MMENEEDVLQLLIQDHQDYDDLEFEIDDEAEAKLLEDVPETNPIESDKTLKDKNDRVDNVDHDVNDDSKQTNNVADNNVRSRNDHKPKRPSKNFQNRNHSMMNRSQNRIRNEIRGFHSRRHQNQRPNMEQFNLNPSMVCPLILFVSSNDCLIIHFDSIILIHLITIILNHIRFVRISIILITIHRLFIRCHKYSMII
ncbi:hypothetical protein SSS_10046 [Sarcoptes scabiei]|nr:hypothetical protein SSS_10046 [Sarcoptes scabiei]